MELSDSYKILQAIVHDMANSPDGISTGEIVRKYGISRRVVPKYIDILEDAGIPIYHERKRYFLDPGFFTPFTLTADESEFLYLILERSLIQHSRHWQTLRTLLHKLGNKMMAPLSDYLIERIDPEASERPSDRHFKLLARAKRDRREVWIEYHPLNRPDSSKWRIRPFRFTGNIWSDGLYVVCHGSRDGGTYTPLTLKLDRILDVALTDQQFDWISAAQFMETWGHAWSVWNSDRDPVRVTLRFEPRHYDRLLETIWHPTQTIRVDNDNYVHFSVDVSEPEEMVPWIRSWGSGVVVQEPEKLRQRIIFSMRRQLQAYGLDAGAQATEETSLHYLWAKYDRTTRNYHLLHYHLLDVSAVAWHMWEMVFTPALRAWLANFVGASEENARQIVALLVGLHDIGKATPTFQKKASSLYEMLREAGIKDERTFDEPHGVLSAIILDRLLVADGMDKRTAKKIALVIGGHHGEWINRTTFRQATGAAGREHWSNIQAELFTLMKESFSVGDISIPSDPVDCNIFAAFLSGFTSVCDWIGSNETYFPYEANLMPTDEYLARALQQAQGALNELGWHGWRSPGDQRSFEAIFPFPPNPMQQAAINSIDLGAVQPRLILVEYLTGGGKTELALYLADMMLNLFTQNGIYVAMPTQATSNQMFERMSQYLETRYPQQAINLQLIHAQAEHNPHYQQMQPQPVREGNEDGLTAELWFQNRRRALLAPFAVGTIDQAMLSVLQTRHHFVRQYGLSNKTIIFDEIHAYDTYMNQIIERLLEWLDALNSPVIMLSATLPRQTREELLKHVGASSQDMPDTSYPRMTVVDHDRQVRVYALPKPPTRLLRIEHLPDDVDLATWLAPIYSNGGCIAVICNTVDESITVTQELRHAPDIDASDVMLFHGRFPPAWRQVVEADVLERFSKDGSRPQRMILVATQIIEQSLDLDFDLMITRVAPIDLLIQRAGRLHRHEGRSRPAHLQEPRLIVRTPAFIEQGVPDFGVDEAIYARFILLQTWLTLRHRHELMLPDELDQLMVAVYSDSPLIASTDDAYAQAVNAAYEDMTMGKNGERFRGSMYRIAPPHEDGLIGQSSYDLPDDERNISTRDIQPGVDIICMSTDNNGSLPTYIERKPTKNEVNTLLQHRITIRKKHIKSALEQLPQNPYWERIPQLRYARPVIFTDGHYHIPNSTIVLRLTPDYGLEI